LAEACGRPSSCLPRLIPRLLCILLASFAQFHQLNRDLRFQPDEAYFMRFARAAAVQGDWLLPGPLDKPPLSLYASALSMSAFAGSAADDGVLRLDPRLGEFAGRLPNVWLALMLAALLMRWAGRAGSGEAAVLFAGLLAASSPFLLTYVFTPYFAEAAPLLR